MTCTMEPVGRRTYTDDQKAEALALYATDGPTAVQTELGIPKATVAGWAASNGTRTVRNETAEAATDAAMATMAERKARLASDLLQDAQRLRSQLFAPCIERKAHVVSGGGAGGHVEITDIERSQPTFAEKARIMTTIAIAIDKVQILTGQATEITEHRHLDQVDIELQRLTAELDAAPPAMVDA